MGAAKENRRSVDDRSIAPGKRRMVHIKTKEECRMGNETIEVWSIELPSKHAESILKVIKENIPGQDNIDLQHLRRFARPKFIPQHVVGQRDLIKEMHNVPRAWETTPSTIMQGADGTWGWSRPEKKSGTSKSAPLYLLVCPAKTIAIEDLHPLLMKYKPFNSSADSWAYPLQIKKVTVPLLAPTTQEQAAEWSTKYWPTFYRKTNPFGAHPGTILGAENELQNPVEGNISIESAMSLAEQAAEATSSEGYGPKTGCCIVERVDGQTRIIAVAGDARHKPMHPSKDHQCPQGNPMCHSAMRAIGMVARKRLRVASQTVARAASKATTTLNKAGLSRNLAENEAFFLDKPLSTIEQRYFDIDNVKPDGYLCLKLEVFLTHEPCVMCSMALVHSRVGRVIFKERMPKTGGLTAELVRNDTGPVGLGYGLCWRKELNWQFMCWEYTATTYSKKPAAKGTANGSGVGGGKKGTKGNLLDQKTNGHNNKGTSEKYNYFTALVDEHEAVDEDSDEDEAMFTRANVNVSSYASIHV